MHNTLIFRFLPVVIVAVLLCGSCTIQKRHFGKGYYISWHRSTSKQKGKNVKTEEVVEEDHGVESDSLHVAAKDSLIEVPDLILSEESQDSIESAEVKQKRSQKNLPELPKEERKFEPLGVWSFKILLSNLLFGLIGENSSDVKVVRQCEVLFFAVLIISFVLAVISMIRYLRNPKHYKFNIWAILVLLVTLFYFVELLLGNFALFILYNSW